MKIENEGQIFKDIDVSQVDTIFVDANNRHGIIESLKGGELFQKVTIYKYTNASSITIADRRSTAGGNIFNLRNSSVIMQADRNESVTLMKTPSGWNTLQQPRYYEVKFGRGSGSEGKIWYREAYSRFCLTNT